MSATILLEPTVFAPSGTPLSVLAQIVAAARKGIARPADEVASVGRGAEERPAVGLAA